MIVVSNTSPLTNLAAIQQLEAKSRVARNAAASYLRSDNGPEFIAFALQQWLRDHHCHSLYIKPGSPWENPDIEVFNGTFRVECLNHWLFTDGQEAQAVVEQWRQEYSHLRPHRCLGYIPPAAFAEKFRFSLNLDVVRQKTVD